MLVHRSVILLWIALSLTADVVGAVTVGQIPNPRPGSWAVDLTGTLPAGTLAELNRLGDDVKARTGAELVVVVVGSTDGIKPRDFALRLSNSWGIGERDKDNGLLVFAALNDRKVEILLGDGVDSNANIRESKAIVQGVMLPQFRRGDPAGAVLQGAQACARRILDAGPRPDRRIHIGWVLPLMFLAAIIVFSIFAVLLYALFRTVRSAWPSSTSRTPKARSDDDALLQTIPAFLFSPASEDSSSSSAGSADSGSGGGGSSSGDGASGSW